MYPGKKALLTTIRDGMIYRKMIDLSLSTLLKKDSIILFCNGFRNTFTKLFSTASMNRYIFLPVRKLVKSILNIPRNLP